MRKSCRHLSWPDRLEQADTLLAKLEAFAARVVAPQLSEAWRLQAQRTGERLRENVLATMRQVDPSQTWQSGSQAPTASQQRMLLAALLGCDACPHYQQQEVAELLGALSPEHVMVVDLARRFICCRECHALRMQRPYDEETCDLCGLRVQPPMFRALAIIDGRVLYLGNLGTCCETAFLGVTK